MKKKCSFFKKGRGGRGEEEAPCYQNGKTDTISHSRGYYKVDEQQACDT